MTRALLLLPLLLAPLASAQDVTPVASYTVTTETRTLRGCPLKRVITTREGWDRVTRGLEGAPPAPDFTKHVAVLIVADVSGGAKAALRSLKHRPDGALHAVLERDEPRRMDVVPLPSLRCFFLVIPPFAGGIYLEPRTVLAEEGSGVIALAPLPPHPSDRDPARLPQLRPDMRLTYAMADGSPAPKDGILLRQESIFSRQEDGRTLPGRVQTDAFPPEGIVAAYPRFRDGVRFVLAAHGPNHRTQAVLELTKLPADGPDGSPAPLDHRFLLEPVVTDRR
jgi:hypothetical protein